MIRTDHHNQRAVALSQYLERRLDPASLPPDLCLVLGGDGMMLRTIRDLGEGFTFLGLNCGRVGFLMNDVADPAVITRKITEGRYQVHSLPRLALEAHGERPQGGSRQRTVRALALNDIFVERMTPQSCHLKLSVDGAVVVERLVCDGLVVSTALGSTAYSLSAGGSACHPLLPTLHVTPICSFHPRLLPLVLPLTTSIGVQTLEPMRRPTRAVADGVGHPSVTSLSINAAGGDVRLAFLEEHDFTSTLLRKVLLP